MKKSLPYEIAAVVSGILGAFILVGVYMPLINPGLTRIHTNEDAPSLSYYIFTTPIPLLILIASWRFNKKAVAIQQESGRSAPVPETVGEAKLKWIVGAIVTLGTLTTFLWQRFGPTTPWTTKRQFFRVFRAFRG